jgi:curved DNA-binding protein CbpA
MSNQHPRGRAKKGPTTEEGKQKLRDRLKKKQEKEQRRKEKNRKKNLKKRNSKPDESTPRFERKATSHFEKVFFELNEKEKQQEKRQQKQNRKKKWNEEAPNTTTDNNQLNSNISINNICIATYQNYQMMTSAFIQEFNKDTDHRRKVYIRLSLLYHPDKHPENPVHFTEVFKCIQKAYESVTE